jgi:hypothetical protein
MQHLGRFSAWQLLSRGTALHWHQAEGVVLPSLPDWRRCASDTLVHPNESRSLMHTHTGDLRMLPTSLAYEEIRADPKLLAMHASHVNPVRCTPLSVRFAPP